MKFVIVFAALVAVCAAAPIDVEAGAETLSDTRNNDGVHGYQFDFATSNGINRHENGVLKPVGEIGVIIVDGAISWTAPDGHPVSLKFVADETGYHPTV